MLRGRPSELRLCALFACGLAVVQWWPMLASPFATGFGDWQMIHHNWEAAFIALSRFGEWPLWDPFHCGGVPILGNPESQLYAPWFWLSFVMGSVLAVKVMLLGHVACAALGMYWLARQRYQLRAAAAAVSAVAWSCSGCFVWDGAGGHATFLSFAFAPWLSFFIHRAHSVRRDAAIVSGLLLLCLLEGGTYPLPFFTLWILFELGLRAVQHKAPAVSAQFAALTFGLLGLCGAIRFVPIYLALQAHPRQVANHDALSMSDVWTMLTARTHDWRVPGHPFVWPEYGSYVGVAIVVLAVLGVPVVLRRARAHVLVALALYLALMLGNVGDYAPYSLLHRLPVYDSLRVPSRFAIFATFYVALLAGHAVDFGLQRVRNARFAALVGAVCVVAVCGDLLSASWPTVSMWKEPPLSAAQPAAAFHLVAGDYQASYASYPRLNLGTRACYVGGMNWPIAKGLWVGEKPQLRLPAGTGKVVDWQRSPNSFHAVLAMTKPARVRFNQNFSRGFVSNVGQPLDEQGLLALDLPAGQHTVIVRYRPREFLPSALASGVGLLLLVLMGLGPQHKLLTALRRLPARRSPQS
jgi:hypothetical protein